MEQQAKPPKSVITHARFMPSSAFTDAKQVRANLFEDGSPLPKNSAGADVKFDAKGPYIEVTAGRMYYLVRSSSFGGHLLALQPEGSGLTLHSFTYGKNCQLADQP